MNSRKSVLEDLISFKYSVSYFKRKLKSFGWDSEYELVLIAPSHFKQTLKRYVEKDLSQKDIYEWANLIEIREDIGFEKGWDESLKEITFELANPEITEKLSICRAYELIETLE